MVNYINVTGILFDIAGAIFVAWGVLWNSVSKIARIVATTWDYNKAQIAPHVEQWIDTAFGLSLLVTGFVLQLYGSFATAGAAFASCLAAIVLLFLAIRGPVVARLIARVLGFLQEKKLQAN